MNPTAPNKIKAPIVSKSVMGQKSPTPPKK